MKLVSAPTKSDYKRELASMEYSAFNMVDCLEYLEAAHGGNLPHDLEVIRVAVDALRVHIANAKRKYTADDQHEVAS